MQICYLVCKVNMISLLNRIKDCRYKRRVLLLQASKEVHYFTPCENNVIVFTCLKTFLSANFPVDAILTNTVFHVFPPVKGPFSSHRLKIDAITIQVYNAIYVPFGNYRLTWKDILKKTSHLHGFFK